MHYAGSTEDAFSNSTSLSAKTENRKVVVFEHFQNQPLNNSRTRVTQPEEIEFIIGGHSKDGVAKRVQLKINDLAN